VTGHAFRAAILGCHLHPQLVLRSRLTCKARTRRGLPNEGRWSQLTDRGLDELYERQMRATTGPLLLGCPLSDRVLLLVRPAPTGREVGGPLQMVYVDALGLGNLMVTLPTVET
jgi:hypothetical protein